MATTRSTPSTAHPGRSIRGSIWKPGIGAGLAAAAATTLIVIAARTVDVPVAVSGETIPIAGFAQFTIVGALLGIGLASLLARRADHPRRTFLRSTVALTVLSIVPDALVDATAATKFVLALTHVVAAAIIIPVVARHLAD